MKGIPVVTISALTGHGLDRLLPAVRAVHASGTSASAPAR